MGGFHVKVNTHTHARTHPHTYIYKEIFSKNLRKMNYFNSYLFISLLDYIKVKKIY